MIIVTHCAYAEGVVSCFLDSLKTFFDGEKRELLDYADLVHLKGHLVLALVEFYWHKH